MILGTYRYDIGLLIAFNTSMSKLASFFVLLITWVLAAFQAEAMPISYGAKDGYTYDIEKERYTRVYETPLIVKPKTVGKSLNKIIFAPRLTKEFKERYEQTFGYTDIQRNFNAPNQYAEQAYQPGVWVTAEEDQYKRQSYANYMVKRLAEHHVDKYFKSNPRVRPVYELKERLSKIDMEVKKGYKLSIRYSYSGNYLNFKMDNPYDVKTKLTLEMNPEKVGPSDVNEARLYLGYAVSKTVTVSSDYTVNDGDLSLIGSRYMGNSLYFSLTATADFREGGDTNNQLLTNVTEIEGEHRLLVGLTWSN